MRILPRNLTNNLLDKIVELKFFNAFNPNESLKKSFLAPLPGTINENAKETCFCYYFLV
ncbi:MAG: hypothetical protein BWY32_02164 [bacterium ADurb.Bin243]|nr:MAG: hypothetical protein BWY32_02164 [bacterium ADurb.Bin243]